MTYPRDLDATDISPDLEALVRELAGRMLGGSGPEYRILRAQLADARINRITLTGAGLYAYFDHQPRTKTLPQLDFIGGDVSMEVETLDAPAGSLLKVTGGKLDFLEIYTFGYNPWPDSPRVTEFGEVILLPIPAASTDGSGGSKGP